MEQEEILEKTKKNLLDEFDEAATEYLGSGKLSVVVKAKSIFNNQDYAIKY